MEMKNDSRKGGFKKEIKEDWGKENEPAQSGRRLLKLAD